MSATANELWARLPPPAVIQDCSRFVAQRLARGAGASAEVADPTPMLREFLDHLRGVHEELGTFSIESDEDRAVMREEFAAGLEDMAETAALAGSEAFARLVAQEIADARAES